MRGFVGFTNFTKYLSSNEYIDKIKFLDSDSKDTKEKRIISYLTINWFMICCKRFIT